MIVSLKRKPKWMLFVNRIGRVIWVNPKATVRQAAEAGVTIYISDRCKPLKRNHFAHVPL